MLDPKYEIISFLPPPPPDKKTGATSSLIDFDSLQSALRRGTAYMYRRFGKPAPSVVCSDDVGSRVF